jgi:recombination protein RecR
MYSSKYLELLVEELMKLPSVGRKAPSGWPCTCSRRRKKEALRLADAIRVVKEHVGLCTVCGNPSERIPA